MFGSFLGGAFGRLCQFGAVALFFVLLANQAPAAVTIIVPAGLAIFGSFTIYKSRHTVRVRG
jgi:hypothetical protein